MPTETEVLEARGCVPSQVVDDGKSVNLISNRRLRPQKTTYKTGRGEGVGEVVQSVCKGSRETLNQ